MPTVDDFKNTIYVPGNPGDELVNPPRLRDGAGNPVNPGGAPQGSTLSISVPPPPGGPPAAAHTPLLHLADSVRDEISGGRGLRFTDPAGADNGVYLPFEPDCISYALLPTAGVTFFCTAALSGCSIFIDQDTATGGLIVSHANRRSMTARDDPAEYLATTRIADQYPEARDQMQDDHHALQVALTGLGMHPVSYARLERADYLACVEPGMRRKRDQGRTKVEDWGGTHVMGFHAGGGWRFWWQTYSILTYERPFWAPERYRSGKKQDFEYGDGTPLATGEVPLL